MNELYWAILHIFYDYLILIGFLFFSVILFIGLVMYWAEKNKN